MNFFKRKYLQSYLKFLRFFKNNDVLFCKTKYYYKNSYQLNLDNPTEFTDKIQWLKLNHYKQDYGDFVCKFTVRKYVSQTIGDNYLNQVYGVFDAIHEIDYNKLPNKFVLKCTHGSGYNVIVSDKSKLCFQRTKAKLSKFFKRNYYKENREAIYKDLKPKIIIEKYLSEVGNNSLTDYKFYCFHGVPKYVLVKINDKKCFYDLNWNKITPDKLTNDYLSEEVEQPSSLNEMIEVATKLAANFIFIRVDLYSIENKVIFGELTFFPTGGNKRINVERFNQEFGNYITLPI